MPTQNRGLHESCFDQCYSKGSPCLRSGLGLNLSFHLAMRGDVSLWNEYKLSHLPLNLKIFFFNFLRGNIQKMQNTLGYMVLHVFVILFRRLTEKLKALERIKP